MWTNNEWDHLPCGPYFSTCVVLRTGGPWTLDRLERRLPVKLLIVLLNCKGIVSFINKLQFYFLTKLNVVYEIS